MNKVILIGRLTADPQVKYTNGMAIATYTLAVDRRRRKDAEQKADFIRITAFDKGAEFADKHFKKGMKLAVTGRIQTGSYTNSNNQKVYTTDVIAEEQEFVESKKVDYQSGSKEGFVEIPEGFDMDGIPFD